VSEALYCFNESLRRARMARFDRLCEINEMFVGYIEAARLGSDSGLDRLRAAIETGKKNGRIWNLAQGLSLLGRALLERGSREESVPVLEEAVQLAETSGVRWFIDEANHWLNMARYGNDGEAPTDP
jgi:hypothetical protein